MDGISRRALLTGAAAGVLAAAGCGAGGGSTPTTSGPADGSPSALHPGTGSASASASQAALPTVTPWQPSSNDIDPQVKARAAQLIESLGTWGPGQGGAAAARSRVSALGLDPALAAQAGPVLGPAPAAALQVLEAQYGGILSDTASVLVVCRQWTRGADGRVTAGGTTVDVRLSRAEPRWRVTALHPAQPGPAEAALPDLARRVLASGAITLSPAAEADIRSGAVHASALDALLTLARSYRMQLSVVRSGHPIDVFGTDRPSDHPRGRAFDVWRVDGYEVVDPRTSRALVEGFMRAAAAAGSYNVGGPWQLGGGAPDQFFSDDTHHDHVHVGFDS
ncbi:hypothetical protein [Streptacidiphilus sp. PB12-B1b]|uniref:hypothetical protein n=1 Tax=Streptacidiphilus sp. PB12-B1b TaxID=2705012 RepID=UPI001CDC0B5B|nr:hypothetical protein [Streptacidiphilus sp. PB12-B1b]